MNNNSNPEAQVIKNWDESKFSKEQLSCIALMKSKYHLSDETLNVFKLQIYDWDVEKAVKFYKIDEFCILHFLDQCDKTSNDCNNTHATTISANDNDGLESNVNDEKNNETKVNTKCPFVHKYHFYTMWNQFYQTQLGFAKIVCEYLFYLQKYNDNAHLYAFYAHLLRKDISISLADSTKCEYYYLKAISLNDKFADAHCGYAFFLRQNRTHRSIRDLGKSMKHYAIACNMDDDPKIHIFCYNFSKLLLHYYERQKALPFDENILDKALFYAQKSVKFKQYDVGIGNLANILFELKQFDQACKEYEKLFEISNVYAHGSIYARKYIVTRIMQKINENDSTIIENDKSNEQLIGAYCDKHGKPSLSKLTNSKIETFSYFDDFQVCRNNKILETNEQIDLLICGYFHQYGNQTIEWNIFFTIVRQYFGNHCGQYVFKCIANNNNQFHSNDEFGHIYRSIIFNIKLNKSQIGHDEFESEFKSEIEFEIIDSDMCDLFLNEHYSFDKLNYGFQIGVIALQLDKNMAFDILSNELSLHNGVNISLPELAALYYPAAKVMGVHFEYDINDQCFKPKNQFSINRATGQYSRSINLNAKIECKQNENKKARNKEKIKLGVCHDICSGIITMDLAIIGQNNQVIWDDYDDLQWYRVHSKASDDSRRSCNLAYFPVFSCVSCNCQSRKNKGLTLAIAV